jgi:O-antigen/teichoic acid export membrane protein
VLKLGPESAAPLVVAALACSVAGMNAVVRGGLQGTFRFSQVALANLLETAVKVAVGVLLARTALGATGAALGILAGLLASSAYALHCLRGIPVLRRGAWAGAWLWRETVPLFVAFAGLALLTSIDLFAVKIVSPSGTSNDQAGLYTAAVTLARMPFFIATALTTAVFPYVARARDNPKLAGVYVRKGLLFSVALLAPVSMAMVAAPAAVVTTFYPTAFAAAAVPLRIMAGGTMCLCVAEYLLGTLQASGDDRRPARDVLVVVALELVYLAVGLPLLGARGSSTLLIAAAAGYDGATLLAAAVLLHRARRFGWHLRPRGVLAFVLAGAAFVLVLLALPHGRGLHLVAAAVAAGLAYAAVAQAVGLLSRQDLALLLSGVRVRRRRRVGPPVSAEGGGQLGV